MTRFNQPPLDSIARAACATLAMTLFAGCAQAQQANGEAAMTNDTTLQLISEVTRRAEPGAPYINSWLLLGTFDNDAQNSGYNRDLIGETSAAPQEGATSANQKWRYFDDRLFSRNYDDYNDLYSYFSVKQNLSSAAKIAYLHAYVYSPSAQNVQLRVGADTSFKAWINGSLSAASTRSTPDKPLGNGDVNNGGRDFLVVPAALKSGWNRLLLKVANVEDGRFGFYARFTTADGNTPQGLIYSTGGGDGKLQIENAAMAEAKTGALPIAWREWPYIGAQPDRKTLLELGAPASSAEKGQIPAQIAGIGVPFSYNAGLGMSASPFKFTARGGSSSLAWTKSGGTLPAGMKLESDGTLSGTPTVGAKLGDYQFAVQVRDSKGATATREYSLTLKERPNRWLELGRLDALIHGPENIPAADVPKLARLMNRQGYTLGLPISFNNGENKFRWPSKFGESNAPDDRVALFKKSLEDEGVGFGMYMGNLNTGSTPFPINHQILMVREALEKYRPKALWFDWLGLDGTALDSLFSTIKSIDPDIVIILNGSERISSGDWDVLTFEGWGAWGDNAWRTWPAVFPWPKKFAPETWRLAVEPVWELSNGLLSDWRELQRIQLSLIGEGYIANMDHSAALGMKKTEPFEKWPLIQMHQKMADWASPAGKPPLYEAYTQVDRGPLPNARYGYNTINIKRDAIYLIALKNPHDKIGLPADGKLNLGALAVKVKSVTLMNANAPLPFLQNASTRILTINAKNVAQDGVATIIKIVLEKPLTEAQAKALPLPRLQNGAPTAPIPAGNLATGKPVWLRSANDARDLIPSAGALAVYGIDGKPETVAVGAGEYAWSFKVDLKKVHTVRRITLITGEKLFATQYRILASQDGKEWTTVVEENKGTSGTHVFNVAPIQARFVRVQAITPDGPNQPGAQMSIAELQIFETAAPNIAVTPRPTQQNNLATGKPSKLLSVDGTRELGPSADSVASKGTDGNANTIAQAGGDYAWTYEVDLGKVTPVGRVNIAFGNGVWATEYNVLLSPDGKEWKTVAQVKGNDFGGPKSHDFAPTKARYVRVQGLKPDAAGQLGAQMGIAELEVFAK